MSLELIKATLLVMHNYTQIMFSTFQKKLIWQKVGITCIIQEIQTIHSNVNSLKFMVLNYDTVNFIQIKRTLNAIVKSTRLMS